MTYPEVIGTENNFKSTPEQYTSFSSDPGRFIRKFTEYGNPGAFDITTNTDFRALRSSAKKIGHHIIFSGTQRDFLHQRGIEQFSLPPYDDVIACDAAILTLQCMGREKHIQMLARDTLFQTLMTSVNLQDENL